MMESKKTRFIELIDKIVPIPILGLLVGFYYYYAAQYSILILAIWFNLLTDLVWLLFDLSSMVALNRSSLTKNVLIKWKKLHILHTIISCGFLMSFCLYMVVLMATAKEPHFTLNSDYFFVSSFLGLIIKVCNVFAIERRILSSDYSNKNETKIEKTKIFETVVKGLGDSEFNLGGLIYALILELGFCQDHLSKVYMENLICCAAILITVIETIFTIKSLVTELRERRSINSDNQVLLNNEDNTDHVWQIEQKTSNPPFTIIVI